jgi:hypothetical protein
MYALPETTASLEQARALLARALVSGEQLEDSLTAFSILYRFLATNFMGGISPLIS